MGGNDEPISVRRLQAAILQNLQAKVVQDFAKDLNKTDFIDEMHSTVNIYTFDHRTGMPRGKSIAMLHLTEGRLEEHHQETHDKTEDNHLAQDAPKTERADDKNRELYANTMGQGNGKGKGLLAAWRGWTFPT